MAGCRLRPRPPPTPLMASMDKRSTQAEVFAETAPIVTSVMDGFNVCIFGARR